MGKVFQAEIFRGISTTFSFLWRGKKDYSVGEFSGETSQNPSDSVSQVRDTHLDGCDKY